MYTLLFGATCKTACTSEVADILYILFLLGTPATANTAGRKSIRSTIDGSNELILAKIISPSYLFRKDRTRSLAATITFQCCDFSLEAGVTHIF